ncbi:hypothetical protein [Streptomyces luteireticuli]|uniref:DUF3784 domain-containing protein n=1 Tax=Streptomyces luteireticuli TaxID=173858 RepID=A0ABP3J054_9ACTN
MIYVLSIGFVLLGLVSLLAAVTGRRGLVCDRRRGYEVPAAVAADPELTRKANALVASWCARAAMLSVPPLVPLGFAMRADEQQPLSLTALLALAGYGFLIVVMGRYPFERIKRMGDGS